MLQNTSFYILTDKKSMGYTYTRNFTHSKDSEKFL